MDEIKNLHDEATIELDKTAIDLDKTAIDLDKTAIDLDKTAIELDKTAIDLDKTAIEPTEKATPWLAGKKQKKPIDKVAVRKLITRILMLTLAGAINALGVGVFLMPVMAIDGGMSGTSIIISKLTSINISIILVVFNIPFFLVGIKKLGFKFAMFSILAICSYSFFMFLFRDVVHLDTFMMNQLTNPSGLGGLNFSFEYVMLLSSIFGGLLSGVGSGTVIRYGGCLDGIEVSAILLSKKLGFTVGQLVMAYNVVMLIIAAFVFNLVSALFSILAYAVGVKAVDGIVTGLDKAKAAMIISDKSQEIAKKINESLGLGLTLIDGHGFYKNTDKKIIYFVVNRFEVSRLKTIVSNIDPLAFVSISEVSDILGTSVKSRKKPKQLLPKTKKPL